jgi:hypothetical protein
MGLVNIPVLQGYQESLVAEGTGVASWESRGWGTQLASRSVTKSLSGNLDSNALVFALSHTASGTPLMWTE